jgi:ribonuclease HI
VRGYAADVTNQQMELAAVLAALSSLKSTRIPVHIHTDSEYVQLGASQRLKTWKRNGWRTTSGSKVKNLELWQELDALMDRYVIAWYKVEGHAGVEMNVKPIVWSRTPARPKATPNFIK